MESGSVGPNSLTRTRMQAGKAKHFHVKPGEKMKNNPLACTATLNTRKAQIIRFFVLQIINIHILIWERNPQGTIKIAQK
jgi:hypothetical protein